MTASAAKLVLRLEFILDFKVFQTFLQIERGSVSQTFCFLRIGYKEPACQVCLLLSLETILQFVFYSKYHGAYHNPQNNRRSHVKEILQRGCSSKLLLLIWSSFFLLALILHLSWTFYLIDLLTPTLCLPGWSHSPGS